MRSGSRAGGAAALSPGLWGWGGGETCSPPSFYFVKSIASYAATGFWFISQVLRSKMLSVDLCPEENLLKVLVFRHEARLPIMPLCSEEYSSILPILVGVFTGFSGTKMERMEIGGKKGG